MMMMMMICKAKKYTEPSWTLKKKSPTKIWFTPEAPIYTRNCVVPATTSVILAFWLCNPKIAAV